MTFNPDEFLQQSATASGNAGFNPDEFLSAATAPAAEIKPEVDLDAPEYARGDSADSPLAGESAVGVADRFALAVGNKEGNLDYLKKKFGEANVVMNDKDVVTVKGQDGKWRAIDPDTLDAPDSWSLTEKYSKRAKELAGEIAENIPTAIKTASGYAKLAGLTTAAATAAPTFGAGAAAGGTVFGAGAAADLALTSMGRALGTYKGDWQTQAKDAMFEGALNVLGFGIEKAAKPTLGYVAQTGMFRKLKDGLSTLTDDNSRTLGGLLKWSTSGKVSEESIEQVAKNGEKLDSLVRARKGLDYSVFNDGLKIETAGYAKDASKIVKNGMGSITRKLYDGIADDVVEGSFKATNADLIDPIMSGYAREGLLKIAGKNAQETAELLAKQNGKLAPGQSWEFVSQKELKSLANTSSEISDAVKRAASDKEVYAQMRGPLEKMFNYRNFAPAKGSKAQVKSLVQLRKDIGEITLDAKDSATANIVDRFFSQANTNIDGILKSTLPESSAKKLAEADEVYASIKQTQKLMLDLADSRNMDKADQLVNAIFSRGGGGTRKRVAIDEAIKVLEASGENASVKSLQEIKEKILLRKAASEFTAPMARVIGPFQAAAIAGGVGAATQGDITSTGTAGAAALALSSPKAGYHLLRTQLKGNQLIRAGIQAAKTPSERALMANQAMQSLLTVGVRTQAQEETTRESLMSQIPGANGGQQ